MAVSIRASSVDGLSLREFGVIVFPAQSRVYHCGQNDYSFDALQAYCFGINIKL